MTQRQKETFIPYLKRPTVTAILVDGGFYRKRANVLFGEKQPEQRADELISYCYRHLRESKASLYRIFYYDCPPSDKVVYHPLLQRSLNLGKTDQHEWMTIFFQEMAKKRKVAIRRGEELSSQGHYTLQYDKLKKLCSGNITVEDLHEEDFSLRITQKGVDMKIGLDIASLATEKLVNQIIMISGDSDFVPAAKFARRTGIDFILDPLWSPITPSLSEHIDGIRECIQRPPANLQDPLNINYAGTLIERNDTDEF